MLRRTSTTAFDDGIDAWCMTTADAAPRLRRCVEGYTEYRERTASFTTRRELPSLRPVLIINYADPITIGGGGGGGGGDGITLQAGEGFLAGLHDRPVLSASRGTQAGVHIWLTMRGYRRLLGAATGALANAVRDWTGLLGADAAALGDRLLAIADQESRFTLIDEALSRWLAAHAPLPRDLAWAFDRLATDPSQRIGALATELGCSRKTLNLRFRSHFGHTAKTIGRLARFQIVVDGSLRAAPPDWCRLAQHAGFFDQSHMNRDFADFAGITPGQYRARLLPAGGGLIEP